MMIVELVKTEAKATKLARSRLLQATPRSLRELLLSAWHGSGRLFQPREPAPPSA